MATDSGSGCHCLSAENRIVFDSGKSIGYYSRTAAGTKRFSDEVATHACAPLFFRYPLSAVIFRAALRASETTNRPFCLSFGPPAALSHGAIA